MQSVPILTHVANSNLVHGEVYSMQHYVIKFVSDLRQLGGFLGCSSFRIQYNWPSRYNWSIHYKLHSQDVYYSTTISFDFLSVKMISCISVSYSWLFLFKLENCTKELCFASKSCHLSLYNHLPLAYFFLKIFSTSNTSSSTLLLTILSVLFNCTSFWVWSFPGWPYSILLARISSSPKTQGSI